jgi:hypothetical protein
MVIAAKPKRQLSDTGEALEPMAFIASASHRQTEDGPKRKRKEPVIIRFDEDTLQRLDRASKKRGLSRAALVRMLVIENLPD